MSTPDFDVIIVGAGTGGCALGTGLSRKGINVLMLDTMRREKIGDKIFLRKLYPLSNSRQSNL